MKTQVFKLADIKPASYNPRVQLTPKDQEYKALDASIAENGLVLPLVVNLRDNGLIGGHQRLSVLLAAGETETNAVVVDMDEVQAKALCIALNKLDGEWDYGVLAGILQELIEERENLASTGFTEADINDLLGEIGAELGGEDGDNDPGVDPDSEGGEIKCMVGNYTFKLSESEFEDLMADIREKVGFTQLLVCEELKRRLFDEI
jgi:ParB-like chromosome segregation protein Spo0J